MPKIIQILGIVGSLRKNSLNRALMDAAVELAPPEAKIEVASLDGIPLFNQDLENDPPQAVTWLKAKVRKADAILFATPEYNYSIPGVLKNAIDWASRPYQDNAWNGKPCGIMGVSTGMIGTARAQSHLRLSCVFLNMFPLNRPQVFISYAEEKFKNGRLEDQKSRDKVEEMVNSLIQWAPKFMPGHDV